MAEHGYRGLHGPRMWVISLLVGAALGFALAMVAQPRYIAPEDHKGRAETAPEAHEREKDGSRTEIATELSPVAFAGGGAAEVGSATSAPLAHDWQEDHEPQDPAAGDAQQPGHELDTGAEAHSDEHGAHDEEHPHHGPTPTIPLWLCAPFALLLLSIAVMPFINEKFWHHHFPDFAFLLGSLVASYYWFAFSEPGAGGELPYGQYQLMHTGLEYYSFIALIGGLYVASGGVLVNVNTRGRPLANTLLLAFGAVIANIVGTTGASVLLIRPFMRMNKGRLTPIHVVMFIFIVSNCGGALTPIGDPPLYLGFLKGVPFEWTLIQLWPMWATTVGMLLAVFFAIDMRIGRGEPPAMDEAALQVDAGATGRLPVSLRGGTAMVALGLIIFGVFVDPILKAAGQTWAEGIPVGPTFQIVVAAVAYFIASREIHEANEFNFFPVKEVGLLFVGIFATMAPALGYLAEHGSDLGLNTPTRLYFGAGFLSAVLDNAPTYLNFLQVALAAHAPALPLNPDGVHAFIASATGRAELAAISLGAVFFGAMTYIGNGPNFMVRAIAVEGGLRMPTFFGYLVRAIMILLPVLLVNWLIWVR
jgi:Na+/H+ antiporter NhaD/arsenite permease-like protein